MYLFTTTLFMYLFNLFIYSFMERFFGRSPVTSNSDVYLNGIRTDLSVFAFITESKKLLSFTKQTRINLGFKC